MPMEFFSVSPEIEEAGEAVGEAYEKLGDLEGHNVTMEQIRELLAARLRFVNLESRDPNFRIISEHGAELMEKIYGASYPWQEEQSDLMHSQPLNTPEAAQAARTWFVRTKDLTNANIAINRAVVRLRAEEDNDATMDLISEYERRNKAFDEAIKSLEKPFKLEYDFNQFERDLVYILTNQEIAELDEAVGVAWNNFGGRKGEKVTFEQLETLLATRRAAVIVHCNDPISIRSEEWANVSIVRDFGENARFTLQEELGVLKAVEQLTTVEVAHSAITWLVKTRELIRINRVSSREVFEADGNSSSLHIVREATRRIAACDNAIKLLRERFNMEGSQ